MTRILTRYRIREVLDDPSITDGEVTDITDGANRDASEGPEWLPYYKAALHLLALSMGSMSSVCGKLIEQLSRRPDVNPDALANMRRVMANARKEWVRHLRLVGIGPQTDPKAIERVAALIEQDAILESWNRSLPRI